MKARHTSLAVRLGVLSLGLGLLADRIAAGEPPAPEARQLIIIDAQGKEQKVKSWQFTQGTRRLAWLAPAVAPVKPDDPKAAPKTVAGPEALVFREENSTTFVEGIETLIPLDRLRSITFDNDKQSVTVQVSTGAAAKEVVEVQGTTKYRGINKLTIEAEVDLGELGIAEAKFQGGAPQGGIRGLTFPIIQAVAADPMRPLAKITATDKGTHEAAGLQPLYRLADGRERLIPLLMFKKTVKIDLAKLRNLRHVESTDPDGGSSWIVTLHDGAEHTLTLLPIISLEDGQEAKLIGLVGTVPAGYKLFPLHTIAEVQFESKPEVKEE
ncbi:MAG: hypothetical protein ACK4RK_02310 [Gemmataceae bacterium]